MTVLESLRAAMEGATKGPWAEGDRGSIIHPGVTRKGDGRPKPCPRRNQDVVAVIDLNSGCGDPDCCSQEPMPALVLSPADRALILAAVNSLPLLLRVAECARDLVDAGAIDLRRDKGHGPELFKALAALSVER